VAGLKAHAADAENSDQAGEYGGRGKYANDGDEGRYGEEIMREIKYADAGMDMKKFMLRLLSRWWLLLAAAAAGALVGAVVYTIVRTVPESEREYQAVSKVYLDFAADESGEVYQEYNGYTWNDLIVTDPILNLTMEELSADYNKEEVMAATEATILSDLRLLTVTITTHRAEATDAILAATDRALENYGESAKEFLKITTIQTTQAQLVVADSRMAQAVVLGAVIALFVLLFGMLLYDTLDDRIFVASDVRKVTDVSFCGYCFEGADAATGADGMATQDAGSKAEAKTDTLREQGLRVTDLRQRLQTDYDSALAYLRGVHGNVIEVLVSGQGISNRGEMPDLGNRSAENTALTDMDWAEAGKADGVILQLPYGRVHGAFLVYLLEQYRVRDCEVLGVAIVDADEKFLHRYYLRGLR
jgi:capsular polysaccharide biosynthesis protein